MCFCTSERRNFCSGLCVLLELMQHRDLLKPRAQNWSQTELCWVCFCFGFVALQELLQREGWSRPTEPDVCYDDSSKTTIYFCAAPLFLSHSQSSPPSEFGDNKLEFSVEYMHNQMLASIKRFPPSPLSVKPCIITLWSWEGWVAVETEQKGWWIDGEEHGLCEGSTTNPSNCCNWYLGHVDCLTCCGRIWPLVNFHSSFLFLVFFFIL